MLPLFLVPEALRFDNALMECARHFPAGGILNTIPPKAYEFIVENWSGSLPGDRTVLLAPMPPLSS